MYSSQSKTTSSRGIGAHAWKGNKEADAHQQRCHSFLRERDELHRSVKEMRWIVPTSTSIWGTVSREVVTDPSHAGGVS